MAHPVRYGAVDLPEPGPAPLVGEHGEEVRAEIAALKRRASQAG